MFEERRRRKEESCGLRVEDRERKIFFDPRPPSFLSRSRSLALSRSLSFSCSLSLALALLLSLALSLFRLPQPERLRPAPFFGFSFSKNRNGAFNSFFFLTRSNAKPLFFLRSFFLSFSLSLLPSSPFFLHTPCFRITRLHVS